jgi:hypothetical protein
MNGSGEAGPIRPTKKEIDMANEQTNNNHGRTIVPATGPQAYPSQLHEILGMTPRDVEADLNARGKTADEVIRALDGLVEKARGVHARKTREIRGGMLDYFKFTCGAAAAKEDDVEECLDSLESLRFYEESVAAGIPMADGGDIPYRTARGSDFFGQQDWKSMFVAKVSGWSMREDHITDGDVVLVDSNARPKDGDIVLAYIVGEGQVVKRLRLINGERMILESANPDFASIVIDDPARVTIRGVVKGRAGQL